VGSGGLYFTGVARFLDQKAVATFEIMGCEESA
jgi:hypothetical protein